MKSKVISVTCAAILAFSLIGCGSKEEDPSAQVAATETETTEATAEETVEVKGTFVKMNIPYGEFFAAEFEGGDGVDAVSSATMNKASNEKLTGGTYHLEDNSKILGVSFPVCVPEGTTLDESLKEDDEEALYSAPDHSYVAITEAPANYKELTVDDSGKYSFGKTVGDAEDFDSSNASINTATFWGDYEIDLDESLSEQVVFAASIHTTDGKTYAMRSLENVWRGFEIAFATTDKYEEPHGNIVAYQPYEDLPGKTVDEIVLYTKDGVKKAAVNLYLPLKFENEIKVEDATQKSGTTTVKLDGFPEDYDLEYEVEGDSKDIVCDGTNITWKDAIAGKYTLKVSDKSGVYAPYTSEFVLSTDKAVAEASEDGVKKADDATDDEFAAYIKNIEKYDVNGTEVSGAGHHGAKIVKEDGTVDKTLSKVFDKEGSYKVVVKSAGYPDVTLNVEITEVAPSEEGKK
ncbi:MAG: DUF1533 domain-containing protein [Butyrivibrio sp.]|nr:DUF1533 domain-containing protein [Butyrivibrio sp.]